MTQKLSNIFSLAVILFLTFSTTFSQSNSDVYSPKLSHLSGRYNSNIQVTLTATTANSIIYYTLDGTTPSSSSTLYTGAIPIGGDGNQITLKAIAIAGGLQSFVSSSIYAFDYSYNPNTSYLTNLSVNQYQTFLPGNWFGYTSTPWTCDYSIKVKILPDGNYIDTTTSTSCLGPTTDDFLPAFYYGITDTSSLKHINLNSNLNAGFASGNIIIDFGVGTNQYELRYIKFKDENNLFIEFWHNTNGPLRYYLTKHRSVLGLNDNPTEQALIYPNPASEYLSITDLNSDVLFTNSLGQTFTLEKSDQLAVSHLPKGLYFIRFSNQKGETVSEKVVIN